MRSLLSRILILLAVIGLVIMPPVLTGYANLRHADAAYLALDDVRATIAYERAAILLPWRPNLWDQAGVTRFRIKDFSNAIRLLEIAKRRNALSDVGWDALGISYFKTGNLDAAAGVWESGLEAYPSYAKYYSRLFLVYHQQGNIPAERGALESWVASDGSHDALAHYRLGQLLTVLEPDRALKELLRAASLDSQYDSAAQTMRTTLNLASLETDESRRMVLIGRGLGLIDEWQLAVDAFRRAVTADGENAEAWAWLGEGKQHLGQDGSAELDQACALGPGNPIVRSLRGLHWMRQEQYDQALKEYRLAAAYDPENPVLQASLGQAYTQSGDLQAALRAYVRATEIAPEDVTYWRLLAIFSANDNMQVEDVGLPAALQAIRLAPNDPQALDTLGWNYLVLDRYKQASYQFARALEVKPDFALAHLHAGLAAFHLTDWQSARDHWQQAYKLDTGGPAGEQAQRLLDQFFP